ncbi:marine proteobacterial sortase target protein [Shewanella sairae]|uniref:Marine proteobacterial sortase target protein n=1 Tax=Shewanella sairae TaxID=190310 RepID=A0ABQ4P6M2_9GAMM|nr:marine proteobacterial sortase target protein [Shewanella sairae]MCL1130747.1 marine proteobacterial sortase target protein [Shewanella sairae]GIU43063.1 marine proteobacterial sortase target protein [Shewanella sairae]
MTGLFTFKAKEPLTSNTMLKRAPITLSMLCLLFAANVSALATTPESIEDTTTAVNGVIAKPFNLDQIKQGSLVFENAQGELSLALPLQTIVSMHVSGWTNRVAVRHEFSNHSTQWVNGQYIFPLPNEAAVDTLKLYIGDRVIEGQIQPKKKAKAMFEQAKAQGKKASLLEQKRANIFKAEVANLAPNETLIVELSYQETLDYKDGEFSLRFPMVVAPRYTPEQTELNRQDHAQLNEAQALSQQIMKQIRPEEYQQYVAGLANTDNLSDRSLHQQVAAIGEVTRSSDIENADSENTVVIEVVFDAAMAVDNIVSPYHSVSINMVEDAAAKVTLQRDVKANRDFVLTWQPLQGSEPTAAVFTQQGKTHQVSPTGTAAKAPFVSGKLMSGEGVSSEAEPKVKNQPQQQEQDKYALVMLMPPQAGDKTYLSTPRELILVIDTSGSMSGDAIVQAKSALKHALAGLRSQDSFNILQFNSGVSKWSEQAMPATAANIGAAQRYIHALQANGGTEMALALDAALAQQSLLSHSSHPVKEQTLRQVLFITDGAVANESMLFTQIEDQLADSRLFTIGIGSAPNAHFMQRAAELGRGTYTYIGKLDEVNNKMVKLLEKIEKPQVTDVDLKFSDGSIPDYWPVRIPDLYAHEPILVAVRIPSFVDDDLLIQGFLAGQFWQHRLPLDSKGEAKGLDLVWARKQIAALELSKQGANKARIEKQITAVAMNFHIMSAYTSLVAVDITPAKPQGAVVLGAQVKQHLPHGWHSNLQGVTQTLPQTGTNSYVLLIFGGMLLLLAALYRLSFYRSDNSSI